MGEYLQFFETFFTENRRGLRKNSTRKTHENIRPKTSVYSCQIENKDGFTNRAAILDLSNKRSGAFYFYVRQNTLKKIKPEYTFICHVVNCVIYCNAWCDGHWILRKLTYFIIYLRNFFSVYQSLINQIVTFFRARPCMHRKIIHCFLSLRYLFKCF